MGSSPGCRRGGPSSGLLVECVVTASADLAPLKVEPQQIVLISLD